MAAASLSRDWIYGVNSWIMGKIALFPDQACRGGDLDVRGADGKPLGWRATAGWGCPGAVGGWPGPPPEGAAGLLRFAFYGRVSTEDWRDPESSRARQLREIW